MITIVAVLVAGTAAAIFALGWMTGWNGAVEEFRNKRRSHKNEI